MKLTAKQALSFVEANSKGAPKHFFDARLGAGQTPKVSDFTSDDAEGLEKAEEFISCLQSVIDALTEHLRYHPKQTSLLTAFDKQKKTPIKVADAVMGEGVKINPKWDAVSDKPAKKKPTPKKTPAKKAPSMAKKKPAKKKPAKKKP